MNKIFIILFLLLSGCSSTQVFVKYPDNTVYCGSVTGSSLYICNATARPTTSLLYVSIKND